MYLISGLKTEGWRVKGCVALAEFMIQNFVVHFVNVYSYFWSSFQEVLYFMPAKTNILSNEFKDLIVMYPSQLHKVYNNIHPYSWA